MGSPSPRVSVSSILYFTTKRRHGGLHHIRPSLLLTSATLTTIHFSFHDLFLTQLSSSLRCTCPYHRSLASRILSVIQATPTALRISSFLFQPFLLSVRRYRTKRAQRYRKGSEFNPVSTEKGFYHRFLFRRFYLSMCC